MIRLELDGLYPWSNVECLEKLDDDIYAGVDPNIGGIKILVNIIRSL